uniref:Zinc finger protein 420-like n=1 Tax=Xiphophorus maculatus TaxID=8083 RepID=A0A3B5QF80_XIPMA
MGDPLPLASLRLLVPPLQLMAASMWQVLRKQDVTSYWKLSDFVSLVVDMVPELLMDKYRTQLNLGLRARVKDDVTTSHTGKNFYLPFTIVIFPFNAALHIDCVEFKVIFSMFQIREPDDESVKMNFLELIQILLKDPEERKHFFMDVFPAEYGPQYDSDLQTLFAEFLCRLFQLVPVPDLDMIPIKETRLYFPPASMGDNISSSLSALPPRRLAETSEQPDQSDPLRDLHVETQLAPEIAEVVTVSDYSEVEVGASSNVEVVTEENCFEGREDTVRERSVVVYLEKTREEEPKREATELPSSSQHKAAAGPHDCPCCEKKFKFASSLLAHSVIHTGERPHRCTDCGRCFSFRQSLDRHRRTHRKGRSPADASVVAFSCPQCSFQDSEEGQVLQHIKKVHPTDAADQHRHLSCADCGKVSRFHSLLKAHQRVHTGEQPFSCSQCGRQFSFKQSLERHKQTHSSGNKLSCLICGELFKSATEQARHNNDHLEDGDYQCSECGQTFTWKACSHCNLGFNCERHLNKHILTHKEEKPHSCNCGKSFPYRAALTAHQRTHRERPHTCTQCGKGFLYKGGLMSHMKIHSEEMPFMCSFCGKSFKRERNMKKHERCHTRENVFRCTQCDKSFVYKATLIRHELTHSGERPYLCSDCGKGFFSHAELLKHERFHTGHKPFQCPHCGKKFTQSCYLTIHLRYHTGARPYSCSECDKSFLSANRLKRHQRTHSGEKPYLCLECGKGFRQSYHLKTHLRTHLS